MNSTGQSPQLSIGALSRATGIPANTLRTWERRYGFPEAERTQGGHRLYGPEVVGHLILVSRALSRGHRPAQLMSLPLDALRELVDGPQAQGGAARASQVDAWLQATEALDEAALDRYLEGEHARRGMLPFLEDCVAPFLVQLGDAWAAGRLGVYHEHFAANRVRIFLGERWKQLATQASGPTLVLANPPGERHELGLHMAAAVASLSWWRIVFLGADTPLDHILGSVERTGARALGLSLAEGSDRVRSREVLAELIARLPGNVVVVVGGRGAVEVPGVHVVHSLAELDGWLRAQR